MDENDRLIQELFGNPQTATEMAAGFQELKKRFNERRLENFDELIERDAGTFREEIWRNHREGYAKLIDEWEADRGHQQ